MYTHPNALKRLHLQCPVQNQGLVLGQTSLTAIEKAMTGAELAQTLVFRESHSLALPVSSRIIPQPPQTGADTDI